MLKASKKNRNKRQRAEKAQLTKYVQLASKHRINTLDITDGRLAAMYMEENDEQAV